MKITFLGQNGFLFESKKTKIIIDPYLSDSVEKIEPQNVRRQPIDESFFGVRPNVVVVTHSHADHYDTDTLDRLLKGVDDGVFLSPLSVFPYAKKRYEKLNCVLFRNGVSYTVNDVRFRAVYADHSDTEAIGVIISCEEKSYYVTGDTLYSEKVFGSLPKVKFDAVFLPINGKGNNMNVADASRFAKRINAKFVVPTHFGLFDDMTGYELKGENVVVPEIYQQINLE